MWRVVILKWDSLVLSIVSFMYGMMLLSFPQILGGYMVYNLIDELFDYHTIGITFMLLGFMKTLGVFLNSKKIKRISLVSLAMVWSVFSVSFLLSPPPNTIWIFSLGMALLAFGIALKEG